MNIFATSWDPRSCAMGLDDKRVVKMALESAQLLSTALWELGGEGPYKRTHVNHPCAVWVRESQGNLKWMQLHFANLAAEYRWRFDRVHKSWADHGKRLVTMSFPHVLPEERTPFVQCTTGLEQMDDVHEAYRSYLRMKWEADKRPPKWTRRGPPSWEEVI